MPTPNHYKNKKLKGKRLWVKRRNIRKLQSPDSANIRKNNKTAKIERGNRKLRNENARQYKAERAAQEERLHRKYSQR